jgi:LPXTG-motif cell wall-anchored protein
MRKVVPVLVLALGLLFAAAPAALALDDQNCTPSDFPSQAAAQAHLRADPSDPDGLDAHVGPADGNDHAGGDGIACASLPAPFDRRPVFASSAPGQPAANQQADSGEVLAHTGPNSNLSVMAAGLIGLGMLALLVTRYRGRHVRR